MYNLLQDNKVPPEAKEVLVYTLIASIGEGDSVQRGYYAIYTSDGDKVFQRYMNVATGQGVNIVNSANLWVPVSPDKSSVVKLCHSIYTKSGNNHIAGKLSSQQGLEWRVRHRLQNVFGLNVFLLWNNDDAFDCYTAKNLAFTF